MGWLNLKNLKKMTPAGYLQWSLLIIAAISQLIVQVFSYPKIVVSSVTEMGAALCGCSAAVIWIRQGKKWGWVVLFLFIAAAISSVINLYRL